MKLESADSGRELLTYVPVDEAAPARLLDLPPHGPVAFVGRAVADVEPTDDLLPLIIGVAGRYAPVQEYHQQQNDC